MIGVMLTGCTPAPVNPPGYRLPTLAEASSIWKAARPLIHVAGLSSSPACAITITIQGAPDINAAVSATDDAACRGRVSLMVTEGALSSMTFEELRGILAHEIGHVALRHRAPAERRRSNGTGTLSNTSLIGQAVAFAPGLLGIGLWIGSLVIATVGELIARGDDRQQEREADRYAVALLLKLGGGPIVSLWPLPFAKMAAAGGSGSSIGATHPGATERAEEVRRGCAGDATAFVSEATEVGLSTH